MIKKILRKKYFTYPYFLVALLIISNLIFILLFIFNLNSLDKEVLKFNFLNPGILFREYQDSIVNFQPLRESLIETYENRTDYTIALYFEYLPTGDNINLNKDVEMWPASLIKIPVAMSVVKKIQDKQWEIGNELVILEEDKNSEYGDLYKQPTGTTLTIGDLLKETLVDSDNTAHFVLLRNLESHEIQDTYSHLGLSDELLSLENNSDDNLYDNQITAKKYSVFFRSLYNATYLNPEYSQFFLDLLTDTKKEFLGLGIPDNVRFAHKTGVRADEMIWADSGIIYADRRPYLLTVMIRKKDGAVVDQAEIDLLFKNISEEIYTYVTKTI